MFNPFEKEYSEKRGVTTVASYKFAGFGIDAQAIYSKYETRFSIARGVIEEDKFKGYVDSEGRTYNSFVR